MLLVIAAALLLTEVAPAQQQGVPCEGMDFYVGYIYPSDNKQTAVGGRDFHGYFGVYLLITSYADNNQVRISYFDAGGTEIQSVSKIVGARNSIQVPLDRASMQMSEPGDKAEFRACHITSKKPVNIQYFSTGGNSGGSYLAIQTPALGKNYVIASYHDNPGIGAYPNASAGEPAGGYFMIVAPFDSSHVTITPNGHTAGGHIGVHTGPGANGTPHPYTVTLRRGQCYWVKGDGTDETNDLSGSIVTSDKPIAVLAGHEDAQLGDIGDGSLDTRNFMIQQMIPAESFDSTGYVSIPLLDSPGTDVANPGYGENYRVFAFDTNNVGVQAKQAALINPNDLTTTALWSPAREIANVASSTEFHAVDGRKFSVMMYDLSDLGGMVSPFPCESMMSIVPMSHWRTSFLLYVPANTFEVWQAYYINVIGEKGDIDRGNIRYGYNGSQTLQPLSNLGKGTKLSDIPYHSELEGMRYSLNPGSYYFTNTRTKVDSLVPIDAMLHGTFMVYHNGMRAIDPDHDLGDKDGDDFFFSYAAPVGMLLGAGSGNPTATIDTACASWHVCVHDTGNIGIRSVMLLDDPTGDYYRPGKQSRNVEIQSGPDRLDLNEIEYEGNSSSECFDVLVSNPLDTAYAALAILDNNGAHRVVEMRYQPPQMMLSKLPELPSRLDTLVFPLMPIGQQACSTVVFINTAPKGGKSFGVNTVSLAKNDGNFKITSITPPIPRTLAPGDTLKVNVCFTVKDTSVFTDTLKFTADCFSTSLRIFGTGGTPLIFASDIDFGNVTVGTKECLPIRIENRGNLPFILSKQFVLHDPNLFSIDSASLAKLPITIDPNRFVRLTFCYSPKSISRQDSSSIDWKTDIVPPYTNEQRSWSYLRGKPVRPGLKWDRIEQSFIPDSSAGIDSIIQRVHLLNSASKKTTVTNVFIAGATAQEFSILNNQLGKFPLKNFNLDVADTIWIDVVFKPDLSKPYPEKFADRIDSLIASYDDALGDNVNVSMKLIGSWAKSSVSIPIQSNSFSIRPNPASGNSITLSFSLPSDTRVAFSIFDILGREVYRNPSLVGIALSSGAHEVELQLPNLETGIYYGRLTFGNSVLTQKLDIIK
ncbi:MAG: T9SS type A sorting domain-containing protein [Bacteroidota bacterium]|nr:T9SS type A sorting domain-containing protein [Bacteroidota bacterium]